MLENPEVTKAKPDISVPEEKLPTDAERMKGLFGEILKRRPIFKKNERPENIEAAKENPETLTSEAKLTTDAGGRKGLSEKKTKRRSEPLKAENKYKHLKKQKSFSAKKLVLIIVIAAAVAAGIYGIWKLFFYEEPVEMITDTTKRDSITTVIEGSASTTPTSFQMLSIPVDGVIENVFVSQGDKVSVGDELYSIDTSDVEADIVEMEATILDYQNQLDEYNQNISNLSICAPFSGKLVDVSVEEGDNVNNGTVLATLVSDNKMILSLYFSYAYSDYITTGMSVNVSIPEFMSELSGTVESIKNVSYITPEGTECFKVNIVVDNPGSLTEGISASATITVSGMEIYPSDSGALEYYKTEQIVSEVSGEISHLNMEDFSQVSYGELLMSVENDEYADQVDSIEKKIKSGNNSLEELQETLEECSATADVEGTVIFVNIEKGDEVSAGSSCMAIYNTDTMQIEVDIDELEAAYVTLGMEAIITKSGASEDQEFTGEVTEVSLEGTSSNGVSYFPTTITIYSDGQLSAGVYVSYSITAAQASDVVLAPIAALQNTTEGQCLFIKADRAPENSVELGEGVVPDGFYAVVVKTGLTSNNYVEIVSGVEEGVIVFEGYISTGSSVSGSDSTSSNGEEESQFGQMPGGMNGGNMPSGNMGGEFGGGGGPMG